MLYIFFETCEERVMLVEKEGGWHKLLCPDCGRDNIGESGLGGNLVHCFGRCMRDIVVSECPLESVTSPEELAALRQDPY